MSEDILNGIKNKLKVLRSHKKKIDAAQLLVGLYEIVTHDENFFRNAFNKIPKNTNSRYHMVFEQLLKNHPASQVNCSEESVNILILPTCWDLLKLTHKENTGEFCLEHAVLGCLEYLDGLVSTRILSLPVDSPISGNKYYIIQKQYSPWRASMRYEQDGSSWLNKIIIVQCQQNIQLYRLNATSNKLLEEAVTAALKKEVIDNRVTGAVVGLGVWPLKQSLHFQVQKSDPKGISEKQVQFRLKDDKNNDWNTLSKIFRDHILPWCEQHEILVLVLPELSVPQIFLDALKKTLKNRIKKRQTDAILTPLYPILMVAGSFHQPEEAAPEDVVNQTVVLDHKGDVVQLKHWREENDSVSEWKMNKRKQYALRSAQIANAEMKKEFGLNDPQVVFACEPGRLGLCVPVVQTALGSMTTIICLDYLEDVRKWRDLLRGKSWVDWIFVPSASLKSDDFVSENIKWGSRGACALVGNACWLVAAGERWGKTHIAMAAIPQGLVTTTGDGDDRKRSADWFHPDSTETRGLMGKGTEGMPKEALLQNRTGETPTCALNCDQCLWMLQIELDYPERT